MRPRHVHVLFVHGVGRHSRLSSLLQGYQAFRSNLRSRDAPTTDEDPIPGWGLAEFNDGVTPPYLKLTPKGPRPGPADGVYFYEVNYSALAGVIRANQPLDITRLFVGLDLAVNVARARLRKEPAVPPQPSGFTADHAALARCVQKLTGVFVSATVPVLGLPSILLRNYTETFVATFTRFFEDIATFALDKNGKKLISAHVDQTVGNIVNSGRFKEADADHDRDVFVVAAHSLGTIVVHNHLLRHWPKGGREVPDQLLTFGCPISLVCWLWLFLDYPGLQFKPGEPTGRNYFCWDPVVAKAETPRSVQWINVANHLDPIATEFPPDYVNLDLPPAEVAGWLAGGGVAHRFIKTGGALSAGSAHTAYLDDRKVFLEILGRLAQLRRGDPLEPGTRSADEHWNNAARDLRLLRVGTWTSGVVIVGAYLGVIANTYDEPGALLMLPLYAWPPATIAVLTFFQRLMFGGPTKRTFVDRFQTLPWLDLASFPYRLRRLLGLGRRNPDPMAPGPGRISGLFMSILSFLPSAAAMAAPVVMARHLAESGPGLVELVRDYPVVVLGMVGVFVIYLISFAVSEFVAHWRNLIVELANGRYPERRPYVGRRSWPIYVILLWALFMLGDWGLARLTVCWGHYGWLGTIFCNAQWGTFAALLGAFAVFGSLLRDISRRALAGVGGKHFRRTRAALKGYWVLQGAEFAHATVSALLLVLFLAGFGWLMLFTEIRF